jgi:hypothetical protein
MKIVAPYGICPFKGGVVMKRALLTAAIIVIMAALVTVRPASATVTSNQIIPVDFQTFNPCNGELVSLSGEVHIMSHYTEDASGGFHVGFHINGHSTGPGLTTGATYQFTWAQNIAASSQTPPPSEFTFTQQQNVIGQGNVPNFLIHFTLHTTVNAQGQTTSTVENIWAECR